jgi:cobyrinic acid a,c-diamide synthase
MHSVSLPQGEFRGHTFHHSMMQTPSTAIAMTTPMRTRGKPEAVYQTGKLHASYLHYYLPSNLAAAANFFTP